MKLVKAVLALMVLGGMVGLYAQVSPPYGTDVGAAYWFTSDPGDPSTLILDIGVTAGQDFTLFLWLWVDTGYLGNDQIGGFDYPLMYDDTTEGVTDDKMTVVDAQIDDTWSGYFMHGVNSVLSMPQYPGRLRFYASFSFSYLPVGLYPVGYVTFHVLQDPPVDTNDWWTIDTTFYPPSAHATIFGSTGQGSDRIIPAYYPMADGHFFVHYPEGVEENSSIPTHFFLNAGKPNPFKYNTTISFGLPRKSNVTLEVYDISGRLVRTLVSGELNAGVHSVTWDGRDNAGRRVSSGTYFVRMVTDSYKKVSPVLLLK